MLRKEAIEYLRRRQRKEVLEKCHRIAVFGAIHSPSHIRTEKLLSYGVEVAPIRMDKERYLGMPCYAHLKDVPGPVDIVQVYPTEDLDLGQIARETVEKGAKAFWVEEDEISQEVREVLVHGKVQVVEHESLEKEYSKHFPFTGPGPEPNHRGSAASIKDRMTKKPVTVRTRDGLNEAMVKMKKGGFRHLPVVDGQGKLIGVLSDRDIRLIRPSGAFVSREDEALQIWSTSVEQAAIFDPVSIRPDVSLEQAAGLMLHWEIGGLPVVTDEAVLVGIITYSDLLREFIARGR